MSEGVTVKDLVAEIEAARACSNMSSAIRLFVLAHFRDRPV